MKIFRTSDGVKITAEKRELEEMGLSFEDFEVPGIEARIFAAALMTMLRQAGYEDFSDGAGLVFGRTDNELTIYFSRKTPENTEAYELMFSFMSLDELISFCKIFLAPLRENLSYTELYRYGSLHILAVRFSDRPPALLRSAGVIDELDSAKIKEHGRFICDAPLEKILAL